MLDIVIIGAGPAGASAAIFSAKAGKKIVMIDDDKGLTKKALLKNHYGIKEIKGPDLVETGIQQAKEFGTEFVKDQVVNIEKTDEGFKVETENGSFDAKHVILATGAVVKLAEKIGVEIKDATEPRIKSVVNVDSEGKTNIAGIWAAGTAAGVSVHTIITAGDGAKVAINIISELNGERYVDHDF